MTLTPCLECSKELSDQAFVCPHCGATRVMKFLRGKSGDPKFWCLFAIVPLLVVLSSEFITTLLLVGLVVILLPWLISRGKLRGIHGRIDALEGKLKDWYASFSSDSEDSGTP
jgi:DNA-directed RNA polymerase subunit RPC12/RpoP